VIAGRTGWSIKKFVRTARRYRTVHIQAGQHLLTAEAPLPVDLRDALTLITSPGSAVGPSRGCVDVGLSGSFVDSMLARSASSRSVTCSIWGGGDGVRPPRLDELVESFAIVVVVLAGIPGIGR
jgi:hypothetical protein